METPSLVRMALEDEGLLQEAASAVRRAPRAMMGRSLFMVVWMGSVRWSLDGVGRRLFPNFGEREDFLQNGVFREASGRHDWAGAKQLLLVI
jgi:hypothetical protein